MALWTKIRSEKYRFHSKKTKDELVADFNLVFQKKPFDFSSLIAGEFTSDTEFVISYNSYGLRSSGKTEINGVLNYYPKSTEIIIEVYPNPLFRFLSIVLLLTGIALIVFSFTENGVNFYKLFTGIFLSAIVTMFIFYISQLTKDDLVNKFEKEFHLQRLSSL